MDQSSIRLDSPLFAGRLRQNRRSSSYVRRPAPEPAARIQDVAVPAAQPVIQVIAEEKPQEPSARAQPLELAEPAQALPIAIESPKRPVLLYSMAVVLFITGLAISFQGLRSNHDVQAQVGQLAKQSGSGGNSAAAPPATVKPSALAVTSYKVAAGLPRYIDIPSLKVHARVIQAGLTKTGALAAPDNVYDAGWYSASAKPGQAGAMLIDGHISSWTTKGVFYGLKQLVAGDSITITRGDSKTFTYKVVKSRLFDAGSTDMSSLLVSADTGKPGLNLISCSGDVIAGTSDFSQRIAVFAVEE